MGRYLDLAIRALETVNKQVEEPASPVAGPRSEGLADCASSRCAGCYDIEPRVRIHPPKCEQDYLDWLKKWEPKGRVQ
jgi:hypothetical protein